MSSDASNIRVGVIGCGLMAERRVQACTNDEVVICFDIEPQVMLDFGRRHSVIAANSVDQLFDSGLDAVIVSTPPAVAFTTAIQAMEHELDVLLEKPGAQHPEQLRSVKQSAIENGRIVKVGFNHRFFPGFRRTVEEIATGEHGKLMFARATYGHGGRLGYEKEWRANKSISGGGELIDQGSHLLDLYFELFGNLRLSSSLLRTNFWDMEVEDNALLTLTAHDAQDPRWATMHVSWSEWKNSFTMDVYCEKSKFSIKGLTGSYGKQSLTIYRMKPQLGPPDIEVIDFDQSLSTWTSEWENFKAAVLTRDRSVLLGDLDSAIYALDIIERAYSVEVKDS